MTARHGFAGFYSELALGLHPGEDQSLRPSVNTIRGSKIIFQSVLRPGFGTITSHVGRRQASHRVPAGPRSLCSPAEPSPPSHTKNVVSQGRALSREQLSLYLTVQGRLESGPQQMGAHGGECTRHPRDTTPGMSSRHGTQGQDLLLNKLFCS